MAKIAIPEPEEKKEEYWSKHITQWQSSGLTQKSFCQQKNLKLSTFVYWRVKFLKLNPAYAPKEIGQTSSLGKALVPIKLKPNSESTSQPILCTLKFSNGCHLAIHDLQALSMIVEKVI
jgi:hypothetical protein